MNEMSAKPAGAPLERRTVRVDLAVRYPKAAPAVE